MSGFFSIERSTCEKSKVLISLLYRLFFFLFCCSDIGHVVEEHKEYEIKHGERFMQMKSYADKVEKEVQELKAKAALLSHSNEELKEVNFLHRTENKCQ